MVTSPEEEKETFANAIQMAFGCAFPMTMIAAMEVGLFDIIAKFSPRSTGLSAAEIAGHLKDCTNTEASKMVERILRLLVSHGVLSCTVADNGVRLYSLTAVAKFFLSDENGVSLAPMMLLAHNNVILESWACLKDAVLKGETAFNMAHGVNVFEFISTDHRLNKLFNASMVQHTCIILKKVLEIYKGFDQVNHLVDVGGGVGAALNMIVSKYTHVRGTNYDLPQVIQNAPSFSGVEHVAGNMFESVPNGDAIFMKCIIHDWDDEHCVTLLKNCYKAIPKTGKVIVMDMVVPEVPTTEIMAQAIAHMDLKMMILAPAGKERTRQEFEGLAVESGFANIRFVCSVSNLWIIEFSK